MHTASSMAMEAKSIPLLSVFMIVLLDVVRGEATGAWSQWGEWSTCSLSCGSGITTRLKTWIVPRGEKEFDPPFTITDNRGCNEGRCPVDGAWNEWTRWSRCTEACGGGIAVRTRTCYPPRYGGVDCEGEKRDEEECNRVPCPPLPHRFNMSSCTKLDFMCTSRKMCIPMKEFCDETVQCHDGSDENRCYEVDKLDSVKYSYVKDKGSTITTSLSVVIGLVILVVMRHVME